MSLAVCVCVGFQYRDEGGAQLVVRWAAENSFRLKSSNCNLNRV